MCIFLVSKFRIPKTLYLSDGEADNIQWYLNILANIPSLTGTISSSSKAWETSKNIKRKKRRILFRGRDYNGFTLPEKLVFFTFKSPKFLTDL